MLYLNNEYNVAVEKYIVPESTSFSINRALRLTVQKELDLSFTKQHDTTEISRCTFVEKVKKMKWNFSIN